MTQKFVHAVTSHPEIKFFHVLDAESDDNPWDWRLEPLHVDVLSEVDLDDIYVIMKALHVLPDGEIHDCYIDMSLPERISDYAFFVEKESLRFGHHHEFSGEIIAGAALDCFGIYELFYSRRKPEVGIEILRRGLAVAQRKRCIAEDLGYILRDERRFQEAAEMFKIAVEEGPSSCFIYAELAGVYAELGDVENELRYSAMYAEAEADSRER